MRQGASAQTRLVTGHDFSRADKANKRVGLQPLQILAQRKRHWCRIRFDLDGALVNFTRSPLPLDNQDE
jgi:hypothetical protein